MVERAWNRACAGNRYDLIGAFALAEKKVNMARPWRYFDWMERKRVCEGLEMWEFCLEMRSVS